MLYIVMHKINQEIAAGGPPRKELVEGMGKLIGETIAAGKLHDADGLLGADKRVRLKWSGGQRSTVNPPLTGGNELVADMLKLKVSSMDEAVKWAGLYGEAIGASEVDVGPITEAWDIGVAPKPEGPVPVRVLVLSKADKSTESGAARSADRSAKLDALIADAKQAGVFLGTESLLPSKTASRLQRAAGKNTWTDGPFAESKELVSGYTILKVGSKQEALDFATRYAELLGDVELDVRQVAER